MGVEYPCIPSTEGEVEVLVWMESRFSVPRVYALDFDDANGAPQ